MARIKSPGFACKECGDSFPKWQGRCGSCGAYNSITEVTQAEAKLVANAGEQARAASNLTLESVDDDPASAQVTRLSTGLAELDRVLGGGLPAGAAVLIGGEPGIGKSTLLAQVAGAIARADPVLYVTAEEATSQVRARLQRVGAANPGLQLAATNDADAIAGTIRAGKHRVVVVDSIQLVTREGIEGEPGGVSQVRACAAELVAAAKASGTALLLVGHVTKDGGLAGPRLLEHLVDTVLSFEGDRYADLRTLRAVKNRYGATSELGLFRMAGAGLEEVPDPTGYFLQDRDPSVPGSCVAPLLEGNRCLLVEIQALVAPTTSPQPMRKVAGVDPNRVSMVLAVLSRRLRLPLGGMDVHVNATGGVRVNEPAADLAIALAVASSLREIAVPPDLVAIGELGLGGELRPAPRYDLRASEARRLGFKRLLGPGAGQGRGRVVTANLADALAQALG